MSFSYFKTLSRYAKTWADAFELIPNLYQQRPPLEDFRIWRDERVMDEVQWYGWFIDYWMEVRNTTHYLSVAYNIELQNLNSNPQ